MDVPQIQIVPLVQNLELPRHASPRTRADVPAGYGVQEQCLPFTAASGLGLLIPSPIRFGHCRANDAPEGCRTLRSPLQMAGSRADWTFYVQDNPRCSFSGNAYKLARASPTGHSLEPGISFFDREDQQELFKLHLPYIWRTPPEVDTLFLPLLNRAAPGLQVQTGIVETDWYANPVNMVLRNPDKPVHVAEGEPVAQAILISRSQRRPLLDIAASHSRLTREVHNSFTEWQAQHRMDRSAYKVLARGCHGRVE